MTKLTPSIVNIIIITIEIIIIIIFIVVVIINIIIIIILCLHNISLSFSRFTVIPLSPWSTLLSEKKKLTKCFISPVNRLHYTQRTFKKVFSLDLKIDEMWVSVRSFWGVFQLTYPIMPRGFFNTMKELSNV